MRVESEIIKTLAESADIVNTINGGMSLAHVQRDRLSDHYLVTVKVPGVEKKSLKVELHKGKLFVFQLMHLEDGIDIPYLVASVDISNDVQREEIRANYQGKHLNVIMPFGETETDSRDINIY